MAGISVRKLDEDTIRRLQERAASHGVSMEEEVRRILQRAVSGPERVGDLALEIFGPEHGVELQLPDHDVHDPVNLDP